MSSALLLAACFAAAAQEKSAAEPLPRLAVSADKAVYAVGEPVALTFTLTNETGKPLKGTLRPEFGLNNTQLFYRRNGQRELRFVSSVVQATATDNVQVAPEELPHGGSRSHTEHLLYTVNPPGLLLSEPGEYELRAKFFHQTATGHTVPLESNVLRLAVQSAPESERAALAAWNDPELLDFVQGNDRYVAEEKTKGGMRKAAAFAEVHAHSAYAKAARKALLDYLTPLAESKRITPEEAVIYERVKLAP